MPVQPIDPYLKPRPGQKLKSEGDDYKCVIDAPQVSEPARAAHQDLQIPFQKTDTKNKGNPILPRNVYLSQRRQLDNSVDNGDRQHQGPAQPHDPATLKMKRCAYYDAGHCHKGSLCTFAHGAADMKQFDRSRRLQGPSQVPYQPNPVANTTASNDQANRRTSASVDSRMCCSFRAGHCNRGDLCTFAHDPKDLHTWQQQVRWQQTPRDTVFEQTVHDPATIKSKLCTFFQQGCCLKGDKCTFAHGTGQLQPFDPSRRSTKEEAMQPGHHRVNEFMPPQLRAPHKPAAGLHSAAPPHSPSLPEAIGRSQTDVPAPQGMSTLAKPQASADMSTSSAESNVKALCNSKFSAPVLLAKDNLSGPSSTEGNASSSALSSPATAGQLVSHHFVSYDEDGSADPDGTAETAPNPRSLALLEKSDYNDEFCCPITLEPFVDPVLAADGFTYERHAITDWLKQQNTSPRTNIVMQHTDLIPNRLIMSMMATLSRGHVFYTEP